VAGTALVVVNPAARGDAENVGRDVRARLGAAGWTVVAADRFDGPDPGVDLVVAVGGDGTVREVALGLARSAAGPPLLIVPGGTGNSVYRALWGDRPWPEALDDALAPGRHRVRRLDLGRWADDERAFLLGLSAGFLARVVEVSAGLEGAGGRERYRSRPSPRSTTCAPIPVVVTVDGSVVAEGPLTQVSVAAPATGRERSSSSPARCSRRPPRRLQHRRGRRGGFRRARRPHRGGDAPRASRGRLRPGALGRDRTHRRRAAGGRDRRRRRAGRRRPRDGDRRARAVPSSPPRSPSPADRPAPTSDRGRRTAGGLGAVRLRGATSEAIGHPRRRSPCDAGRRGVTLPAVGDRPGGRPRSVSPRRSADSDSSSPSASAVAGAPPQARNFSRNQLPWSRRVSGPAAPTGISRAASKDRPSARRTSTRAPIAFSASSNVAAGGPASAARRAASSPPVAANHSAARGPAWRSASPSGAVLSTARRVRSRSSSVRTLAARSQRDGSAIASPSRSAGARAPVSSAVATL